LFVTLLVTDPQNKALFNRSTLSIEYPIPGCWIELLGKRREERTPLKTIGVARP